jgi:hypothetical protein
MIILSPYHLVETQTSDGSRRNSVGSNEDYKSISTLNIPNQRIINNIREDSYMVYTTF